MATLEPQSSSTDSRQAGAFSTTLGTATVESDLVGSPVVAGDRAEGARAERLFSKSMVISGLRCLLAYVVLPFVTPFIGLAPGVGAGFGLVIGLVAIAANLFSIRRFWRADHRWKKPVTVLHVSVIALLAVLVVRDILELMGR